MSERNGPRDFDQELLAAEALGALSDVQRRRVLQRLGGATLAEIAKSEGRAISSIEKSLKSPNVKNAVMILGYPVAAVREGEDDASVFTDLLQNLYAIATTAERPVIVCDGGGIQHVEMVPDYRCRLDATARFLGFIDPLSMVGGIQPEILASRARANGEEAITDAVEVKRTVSERVRVSRKSKS